MVSKSKATSIRIYKGRTHYNEWTFVYANASSAPGGAGGQMPGGRGGSPFPGGRGLPGRPRPWWSRRSSQAESAAFGPGGRGVGGASGARASRQASFPLAEARVSRKALR